MGAICEAILIDSEAALSAIVPLTHSDRKFIRITRFPKPEDAHASGALHRKYILGIGDNAEAHIDISNARQTFVRFLEISVIYEIKQGEIWGPLTAQMADDADQIVWALQEPHRCAAVVIADGSCLIRRIHAGTSTFEMDEAPNFIVQHLVFEVTYDSVMV